MSRAQAGSGPVGVFDGCDYCDGGWVFVTTAYALRIVPVRDDVDERAVEQSDRRRKAALDSVYPCERCRPGEHDVWRRRNGLGPLGEPEDRSDVPLLDRKDIDG